MTALRDKKQLANKCDDHHRTLDDCLWDLACLVLLSPLTGTTTPRSSGGYPQTTYTSCDVGAVVVLFLLYTI